MRYLALASVTLALLSGCAAQNAAPSLATVKAQARAATAAADTFATVYAAQGHTLTAAEQKAIADLDATNKAVQAMPALSAPDTMQALSDDLNGVLVAFGSELPANVSGPLLAADMALEAYVAALSANAG